MQSVNSKQLDEKWLHDAICSLAVTIPDTSYGEAKSIVAAILFLLDEIQIVGEYEEQFDNWRDNVAGSWCKVSGEHCWTHDHCGFWGHQYCNWCRTAKYPEIPSSCSECGDLMKITENQYAIKGDTE